ncbi:MAG: hypothetical protein GPJ54_18350, partial [Candidatus Heimdallarchaeota archaeon]|nr:hypothetical protein [Candidatus Heimdallarchaeota archaeon]
FSFEPFLEDNQDDLPQGLDPQYLSLISIIENPFRNLRKLPKALSTLPMNAVLHQNWQMIAKMIGLIIIFASPTLFIILQTGIVFHKTAVSVILLLFIFLGLAAAPVYLKIIYTMYNNMLDTKTNTWLVEEIEKPLNEAYQIQWSKKYLSISFLIALILDIELISITLFEGSSLRYSGLITFLWLVALFVGHFGISLMIYISLVSYRYVSRNTRIYDKLLVKITERTRGYTEGHETILSKKNYEVVSVLSDTPGLSIRSMGDIPLIGLGSSTVVINGLIFLIFGPLLLSIDNLPQIRGDETGLTLFMIIGLGLALLAAFGAVILPIGRIYWAIRKFKIKALTELDPFLFDEITDVALKRDQTISNETHVLYMLRNYIYSMKQSPVNPIRLIQIGALLIFYVSRGAPVLIWIISKLGGI